MNLLFRNTLLKIKKSFGRYLSILIIVMIGVGFFAGIRESSPDIRSTLSSYNESSQLMDFKVVSTMGLTDDDVNAIAALDGVEAVIPSESVDVLDGNEAIRVHALEDSVNTVTLVDGRLPKSDTECVADAENYGVGDVITISGDDDGALKNTTFTVIGTVDSPLYLSSDYGTTTVGDGELSSFIFVNKDNFTLATYTEIYVIADKTASDTDFSSGYDTLITKINQELTSLSATQEAERYRDIYDTAITTIDDSEDTLDSETASALNQLAAAKDQLDESAVALSTAKSTLAEKEATLTDSVNTQNETFADGQAQIDSGWEQIDAALQSNGLTVDTLADQISALNAAIGSMQEQLNQLSPDSDEYAALSAKLASSTATYQSLAALQSSVNDLNTQQAQLDQGIAAFNAQIATAKAQIADGKAELAKNEAKLAEGYSEYNASLAEFKVQTADAKTQIEDARAELTDIDQPKWTILDREDVISGYNDLKSGTDTIVSVATVFPLFFILIVLLMTSNTMVRMIEEERNEISALASLGYHDGKIMAGYLFYVLSATVFAVVIGFFVGCTIIPKIIFACFPMKMPSLMIYYDLLTFVLISAVAVIMMVAVTVVFCKQELKQKPASLLRPVPPKKGQSILLEKIGLIWNHLSFTWKVTLRNIFRYKRRVFMTIIGIAGCTALLLTGFGVKDCINGVAQKQYGEIFRYDNIIVLQDATKNTDNELAALLRAAKADDPVLIKQTAITCESAAKSLDSYLVVPEDEATFYKYFNLVSTLLGNDITLDDNGVIISEKIAEIYDVGQGDTLTVTDADSNAYTLTVADVAENYIGNYIYMSKDLYQTVFGEEATYNMIVSGDNADDESSLAKTLLNSDRIVNVRFADDILDQAAQGYDSLNGVVVLIVVIAALLAVIVLYNLTSINISERKREIATLKVLGFSDGETSEYIYREALLLTLLSIVIGFFLGIGLHHFLMSTIERDSVVYFNQIKGWSYLWAFLITMVASILMQIVTYFKLRKIDMIESLKSVE